jgi:hypothetical protein
MERKRKDMHALAQADGVAFEHGGIEVGHSGQSERNREADENRRNAALDSGGLFPFIGRVAVRPAAVDVDVMRGRIDDNSCRCPHERIPLARSAFPASPKKPDDAQVWCGVVVRHACIDVHVPVAQVGTFRVLLGRGDQPNAGCLLGRDRQKAWPEGLGEAFAGSQGETSPGVVEDRGSPLDAEPHSQH